jgi:hypothetical protein
MQKFLKKYKIKVVLKNKSTFMKIAGLWQKLFSKISYGDFMKEYTTTIGSTIYAQQDFVDIADGKSPVTINSLALLVHETEHVFQFRRGQWTRYPWSGGRASMEAKAIAEANRLRIFLGDVDGIKTAEKIRKQLTAYGVKSADIEAAVIFVKIKQQEPVKENEMVWFAAQEYKKG